MQFQKIAVASAAALALLGAAPSEARDCKRLTKTEGAVIGAVGGAVLGKLLLGGTAGTVISGVAGGVAGHEIARKNRRKCQTYRRR
jgi:uncharacterized protein YcfJ